MAAALKGARYLFHAAADYRLWARDPEEIRRSNVEGTRLIMEEALSAGVERIVYTSSVATLKLTDGAASTEDNPLADGEGIGAYKRSKVAAERLVEAMIQRDGLPAVIVNPSTPIGPRDVRPTPTGRIIVEAASGRMPAFVDTGLNLAHVDDVAAGHIAALERGRIGERYILGGDNVFLADMLADIARLVGRRPPTRQAAADHALSDRLRSGGAGELRGVEPFITIGRPADGAPSYVLRQFQGAARAWLCFEALSRGSRRRDRLVSRPRPSQMIPVAISLIPLAIWAYLLFGRGWFWLCGERDDSAAAANKARNEPDAWPSVVAIIPARDEADMIARSVGSLLRQDYPGPFSVVVVDDQSTDGTAAVASNAASDAHAADRLKIVTGNGPPPGWTGKLSAMRQGLAEVEASAQAPEFVLFTDADIAYAPHVLSRLVAIARAKNSVLTSLMVKLRCESAAERWLAPAFVFFFQMLYPFAWVNDPRRATAAAAGGCMLVRREALHAAGGLEAVRNALIDDCALGRAHERAGANLAWADRERR